MANLTSIYIIISIYSLSKEDLEVLSEAAAVVVAGRLGVAEALQQRRRLENLLGYEVARRPIDSRQILHDQFGRLCLARAGLARDDDHLVGTGVVARANLAVRRRAHREEVSEKDRFQLFKYLAIFA